MAAENDNSLALFRLMLQQQAAQTQPQRAPITDIGSGIFQGVQAIMAQRQQALARQQQQGMVQQYMLQKQQEQQAQYTALIKAGIPPQQAGLVLFGREGVQPFINKNADQYGGKLGQSDATRELEGNGVPLKTASLVSNPNIPDTVKSPLQRAAGYQLAAPSLPNLAPVDAKGNPMVAGPQSVNQAQAILGFTPQTGLTLSQSVADLTAKNTANAGAQYDLKTKPTLTALDVRKKQLELQGQVLGNQAQATANAYQPNILQANLSGSLLGNQGKAVENRYQPTILGQGVQKEQYGLNKEAGLAKLGGLYRTGEISPIQYATQAVPFLGNPVTGLAGLLPNTQAIAPNVKALEQPKALPPAAPMPTTQSNAPMAGFKMPEIQLADPRKNLSQFPLFGFLSPPNASTSR